MIYEFIEYFRGIRIGDKIRVRKNHLTKNLIKHIKRYGNCFTIETIQQVENSVMIGVKEMRWTFEPCQIEKWRL